MKMRAAGRGCWQGQSEASFTGEAKINIIIYIIKKFIYLN